MGDGFFYGLKTHTRVKKERVSMEKRVTGRCDYVVIRKCGQGGDGILLYRLRSMGRVQVSYDGKKGRNGFERTNAGKEGGMRMRTKEPHDTMKHIVIRYTNGTAKKDAGPRAT